MNAITALKEPAKTSLIQDALVEINQEYGHITPAYLVEKAVAEASPIHHLFEWDDTEAAKEYRLAQARFMIRTVKLEIVRRNQGAKEISIETTRAYVSPPSIRGNTGKQSYVSLKSAMENEELRMELLERAKIELKGIRNRFKQLNELSTVWDVIEKV